jgi:protein-tyrosine phosphatase
LLAHPERIPFLQANPSALESLVAAGAHAQVTSGSFIGRYGRTAQTTAITMLDAGLVDVIASDAHHPQLRPPEMSAARDWLLAHRPSVSFEDLAVHTPAVLIPLKAPTSS